jgi:hypothetical protein
LHPRVFFAILAPVVALPFQAIQLALLLRQDAGTPSWESLAIANLVLLVGACALASDFPLTDRTGRAVLVGIGIPLLLPGPTVVDTLARVFNPGTDYSLWMPFLLLYLLLLLMLGCAEAGIYLLATRPRPTT